MFKAIIKGFSGASASNRQQFTFDKAPPQVMQSNDHGVLKFDISSKQANVDSTPQIRKYVIQRK
jgi:hypothetical protein